MLLSQLFLKPTAVVCINRERERERERGGGHDNDIDGNHIDDNNTTNPICAFFFPIQFF